jgi:DNA-binding beta-propeller fold protein YncE
MRIFFYSLTIAYVMNLTLMSTSANADNLTHSRSMTCSDIKSVIAASQYSFDMPFDIALNNDGSKGYVSISACPCLFVIDFNNDTPYVTGHLSFPFAGFKYLTALAFNKYHNELYVLDNENNVMYVVHTENDTIDKTAINVGFMPENLIVSPDGNYIFVCSVYGNDDKITIINALEKKQESEILLGNIDPYGMAIANSKLYVVGRNANKVYIIDLNPQSENYRTVIKNIAISDKPYDAITNSDGSYIYISHSSSEGKVSVIHTSTDIRALTIDLQIDGKWGKQPKGMAIENDMLYVANSGNSMIYKINTEKNQLLSKHNPVDSGGNIPENLEISPDGKWLYVVHSSSDSMGSVEIIDISCDQKDAPLPDPPPINCPKSPNNSNRIKWCWNSGNGTNLFRYKIDDSDLDYGAEISENVCYQNLYGLPDGLHTFYLQEYNESIDKWSESSVCHTEIDTAAPCSIPESPQAINAQSKHFTITYNAQDRYNDSSCWNDPSGSGLSQVELWVAAPGEQKYQLYDVDKDHTIDGYFEYTASKDGSYRFITCAIDKAGNSEHKNLSEVTIQWESETVYTENFSGYAILSVGAVTDQEGLDSHTLTADNIYKHLINCHFGIEHDMTDPLDHIKYYNPHRNPHTGVDNFETDNFGKPVSYKLSLQHAIEKWAFNKISDLSGPLYIILINHGAKNTFYLNDSSETVSPQELNSWISSLESKLKLENIEIKDIVIVVGTCYSGSYIPELSGPGRIVIASSAHDEPSFRGPKEPGRVREGAFFVSNLFNELVKGKNLADSFMISVERTEGLTARNNISRTAPYFDMAAQHPLLDDDGDSKGSNNIHLTNDGKKSEYIYLGFARQADDPVCIIQTESNPSKILDSDQQTVSFKVSVNTPDNVNAVWIEIRKPGDRLPTFVDEFRQQEFDLEEIYMSYQDKNHYTIDYQQFYDPGKYLIYFYVKDNDGIISGFNETCIYKNKKNNMPPDVVQLIYPMNLDEHSEETECTDLVVEWHGGKDPNFDKVTYTLFLSRNKTFENAIIKEQLIETMCLVNLPDSWDESDVYWKVIAIDDYGAQSESDVWKFHINNPENALPVVFVNVYDSRSRRPIPNALVKFESTGTIINMTMNLQGLYISRIQPGAYDISIHGDHYYSRQETMMINSGFGSALSFALTSKIQTGDINRNEKLDIGDAVLCLQIISGLDNDYYYDLGALTGEVLELRDAIFILQGVSE